MTIRVERDTTNDGAGLTWIDTGHPLSASEGQAWWAGWNEGHKDGEIDARDDLKEHIHRLRAALRKIEELADCANLEFIREHAAAALGEMKP